jgi:hypothetical protein
MQEIRFTRQVWNSVHGALDAGDLLRCDDATAKHFVDELGCAEFTAPAPKREGEPAPTAPKKPAQAKKPAQTDKPQAAGPAA